MVGGLEFYLVSFFSFFLIDRLFGGFRFGGFSLLGVLAEEHRADIEMQLQEDTRLADTAVLAIRRFGVI